MAKPLYALSFLGSKGLERAGSAVKSHWRWIIPIAAALALTQLWCRPTLGQWADVAIITTAAILAASALFLAGQATALREQVKTSIVQTRQAKTSELFRRFNDPAFLAVVQEALRFLSGAETEDQKWEIFMRTDDPECLKKRLQVVSVVNFFEEAGILHKMDLLDRHMTWDFFHTFAPRLHKIVSPYIKRMQSEYKAPHIGLNYEEFIRALIQTSEQQYPNQMSGAPPADIAQPS